jgi:hypothetical protein
MIRSVNGSSNRASPSSICIPFIRLEKLAFSPAPASDGTHIVTPQVLTNHESVRAGNRSPASSYGAFGGLGATWQYTQARRRRLRGSHLRRLPEDVALPSDGLTQPSQTSAVKFRRTGETDLL